MLRVVVAVGLAGQSECYDLEVPAETRSADLARSIAVAMGWVQSGSTDGVQCSLWADPPGRPLGPSESLADAGVFDGARLVLRLQQTGIPPDGTAPAAYVESVSGRQYPLGIGTILGRLAPDSAPQSDAVQVTDLSAEEFGRTVSRRHAYVSLTPDGWVLKPLTDTRNPTLLNDTVLHPGDAHSLQDGDRIQLGGLKLRFHV